MKKKTKETAFFIGSGNVYKDLGYPNPEEMQAKAALAQQIYETIKDRNLTQTRAAELMGIDQPKVSDVIRGRISKYSLDRLMRFLRALGRDIEIRVKKHDNRSHPPTLSVSGVSKKRMTA